MVDNTITKKDHRTNNAPLKSAETPQISLFSAPQEQVRCDVPPKSGKVAIGVAIDEKVLKAEFQEMAGQIKVAVTTKQTGCAVGVRQTDDRFQVNFNPKLIKTQKQLDEHISFIKNFIVGGIGA